MQSAYAIYIAYYDDIFNLSLTKARNRRVFNGKGLYFLIVLFYLDLTLVVVSPAVLLASNLTNNWFNQR